MTKAIGTVAALGTWQATYPACLIMNHLMEDIDFKLLDDANILLRTPRQHNMYSIDLNNIVPHRDLTCLVAKASADECTLWCDNRGEFRNKEMNDFCSQKGIKREFSNARTPQQNGVAEKRNRTLIEAARTDVEFAYNNSWHASIKCAPFEMLYGRKCRAPICWDQVGERVIEGPEMIEVTNAKVAVAKEKLKEARTRQKSYADKHRRSLEFQPSDHVLLKVSPARGVRCFGIKGKLSPRFIGPFEILDRV
nr:putative nucleotidyltransferase, ribonuclease H [Tanacetum cinerariifolium]